MTDIKNDIYDYRFEGTRLHLSRQHKIGGYSMIKVIIESPYAGDIEGNMKYLHDAVLDCLSRGESPYASHAFFTQFLDDTKPDERALGIDAGLAWAEAADKVVVYVDRGISQGMRYGIEAHEKAGRKIEYRTL